LDTLFAMKVAFQKVVLPGEKAHLVAFDHKVFRRADWFDSGDWDSYESYWMVVDGRQAGCCAFQRNAGFGADPDGHSGARRGSLYIASTGILPQYQGTGLGVRFKRWQIAWARRHGFTRILTNCRRSNRAIIRLNEKFGFKILETTASDYYQGPPEPAVVMELKLPMPQPVGARRIRWADSGRGRVISSPLMSIEQIVALLIAERNRLEVAIHALQGPAKHRGRPVSNQASASAVSGSGPIARKRKMSAAGRKAIGDAARKRWAALKASKAKAKAPSSVVIARKRTLTAAARKAMADAAKRRWAAIKAGKAPNPFVKTKGKAAKKG
jgi:GNAT superfamily N-acetyltransferase